MAEMITCNRCADCGMIANDEEGTPWSYWANLPPGSDVAVRMGIVQPLACPSCAGTGVASVSTAKECPPPPLDQIGSE